jgi:putative ABC transport system permease protein
MIPIRYNVRSLAVRKATTLATAGGVALVVFVLSAALMLSAGVRRTMGLSGEADVALVLRSGSHNELESNVDDAAVNLVLAAPGVRTTSASQALGVAEIIVVSALEKVGAEGVSNVQIRGVPENVFAFRPQVKVVAGRAPRPGSDEALVGQRIAGRFRGTGLGESFDVKKNRPVTVVGVFAADGSSLESEVWVDRETLRQAFGREGSVSSVRVKLDAPSKFDAFRAAVEGDKRLGLSAQPETTYYERQAEGTSVFITALGGLVSMFFSVGAMIGAMITMYAAVAGRQREIGTLRALGFSRRSILASFLVEAVALTLGGGVVGAAASTAMGFVHLSMLNAASFSEMVFSFDPTPAILGGALLVAVAMGVAGGFFPALRAARVSPVAAMRAL